MASCRSSTSEPPLREVSSFLERRSSEQCVTVRLREPLWRAGARVDFLVNCMQAQALLERESASATASQNHPRIHTMLQRLGEAAHMLQPGSSPAEILETSGLAAMCRYFSNPHHARVHPTQCRTLQHPALTPHGLQVPARRRCAR